MSEPTVKIARLRVCGKTADMCSIVATDADGRTIGERTGYVPRYFPGGDEDYLDLDIEVETGRILNWPKRLSQKTIRDSLTSK